MRLARLCVSCVRQRPPLTWRGRLASETLSLGGVKNFQTVLGVLLDAGNMLWQHSIQESGDFVSDLNAVSPHAKPSFASELLHCSQTY